MPARLDNLPAELVIAITLQIEPDDLQQSILSLSRALPHSGVPTHLLFQNVRIKYPEQVLKLYLRLRNAPDDAARVRKFSLESWTVDADVFVNLTALIPSVVSLSMFVGPNFAPEHLEEIFYRPRDGLRFVSMRFRP